ncbi:hypothetical protein PoB_000750600 [Plakobranchus ocellatus]|uniref:Regulatory protein zeste n=1 Tax=Plakobranchus ocellatus TaxID=259542 RepID=A0AAV3YCS3_9GAST|nr:hypothetical protein PoB_000750600 [Plakobranchus ocellatus]
MDASKTYQDLFKVYKAAHPSLKPSEIQMKVNSKWTVFKKELKEGNDKNFNDEMNALKLKVARLKSGSSILSFFAKSTAATSKKQTKNIDSNTKEQVTPTLDLDQEGQSAEMKISSGSSTSESVSTDLDLDLPPSLPSTSTESTSTGSTRTPAQDLIRKELDSVNAKISSFVHVKKTVGLSSELKTDLEKFQKQRDTLQKKLKR